MTTSIKESPPRVRRGGAAGLLGLLEEADTHRHEGDADHDDGNRRPDGLDLREVRVEHGTVIGRLGLGVSGAGGTEAQANRRRETTGPAADESAGTLANAVVHFVQFHVQFVAVGTHRT